GPHGFLSIAAHAHADALSIELRCDGVELLVDPGTYCYHDSPDWRAYFRSTIGHNTLEIDGRDQSTSGGPFLWTRHARSRLLDVHADDDGSQRWVAEHDGYADLPVPAHHRRSLTLDPAARSLRIVDRVETDGAHALRLAFHLGPTVDAVVNGAQATLRWEQPDGGAGTARLFLPDQLTWKAHRGSTGPVLGWYSAGFGQKQPTTTLVGTGHAATVELVTEVQFTF
ncbi:MAG TPA: heparinase II/III-family protein, partial [Acidimicrobiales bacterium]|nr:heparinase II/III-family protein [Acidimicrobiales bacterium]